MKRWVHASTEQADVSTDEYVVRIYYEVDPGHDTVGPSAGEAIFLEEAESSGEAIKMAEKEWGKPFERIEIVEINPDHNDYEIPFE